MNDEMLRVLKMVEEGKLAPEEASKLIEAIQQSTGSTSEDPFIKTPKTAVNSDFDRESFMRNDLKAAPGERFLQVRVLSSGGDKVKINLPLNFVKGILKVTGKLPGLQVEHMQGVNVSELMEAITAAIEADMSGRIVDVESADGDFVIVEIV